MAKRYRTILVVADEAKRSGVNGRFRAPAVAQMSHCHGEVLLVSAFDTLPSMSPGIVDAMTLSVPVEGNDEAAALQKLALELAEEYDMRADIALSHDHLIVRLTRQDYGEI